MASAIRVTTVVENSVRRRGLLAEHGLSFWIDTGSHKVLFDTGQGAVLAGNADAVNVHLAHADAIVLSHGHDDHTGGLRQAMDVATAAKVFLHPDALLARYTGRRGHVRAIGLTSIPQHELRQTGRLVWTAGVTEPVPGVFVTGKIPRTTTFEDTGGSFYFDPDCRQADHILDDQAVFFGTDCGTVVLLGCAHAGIVNTLNYIRSITGRPIHAVIGGMHLLNASPERLAMTTDALREMEVQLIAPAHCTGAKATAALWNAFPANIDECSVGTQWTFIRAGQNA